MTISIKAGKRARRSVDAAAFGFWGSTACFVGMLAASPIWIVSWAPAGQRWHSRMCLTI